LNLLKTNKIELHRTTNHFYLEINDEKVEYIDKISFYYSENKTLKKLFPAYRRRS